MTFYRLPLWAIILSLPVLTACSLFSESDTAQPDVPSVWQQAGVAMDGQMVPGRWWSAFQDPVLDQLVEHSLAKNTDQRMAVARLREARAVARNANSQLYPVMTANATGERAKASQNTGSIRAGTTNLFSAGFDASWEMDLFGRLHQQRNAALAEEQAIQADSDAVKLSLISEVAAQYTQYRLYRAQADLAHDNAIAQEGVLKVTQARYEQGVEGQLEVTRAQTLLETTRAQIPQYQAQAQGAAYQIDYLTGEKPGANKDILEKDSDIPLIDRDVFLQVPLAIMQNRPDIIAAQKRLVAATSIKQATITQLYPTVSLSAALGLLSGQMSTLAQNKSQTWTAGGGLLMPLFDFGRIRADIDASKAREEQASIAFEQAVLAALRDIETAASNYTQVKSKFMTLDRAAKASHKAVDIARKQYHEGILSQLDVLQAEQAAYESDNARAQAAADMTQSFITLCKSLALTPDETVKG